MTEEEIKLHLKEAIYHLTQIYRGMSINNEESGGVVQIHSDR